MLTLHYSSWSFRQRLVIPQCCVHRRNGVPYTSVIYSFVYIVLTNFFFFNYIFPMVLSSVRRTHKKTKRLIRRLTDNTSSVKSSIDSARLYPPRPLHGLRDVSNKEGVELIGYSLCHFKVPRTSVFCLLSFVVFRSSFRTSFDCYNTNHHFHK